MCGICALVLKNPKDNLRIVPEGIITMNFAQQNRGQKSSGIAVYNPLSSEEIYARETMVRHKGHGMVSEVFGFSDPSAREKIVEKMKGIAGVGHNRYSTSGRGRVDYKALEDTADDEDQPFFMRHARPEKRMAVSYNGNMANHIEIAEKMKQKGYERTTNVDTELWMNLLAFNINQLSQTPSGEFRKPDWFEVMTRSLEPVDGASNLAVLFGNGELLFYRGGFHPMVYGENERVYAIASESIALEATGIKNYRDLRPGEAGVITKLGASFRKISVGEPGCHFEDVYFANSSSIHDCLSVRARRRALGESLAKNEPLMDRITGDRSRWMVVPSPKTAIPASEAYAETLGLVIRQAIEKREGKKGFINPQAIRHWIMDTEYVYHEDVKGKRIILPDDSIVRGDTARRQILHLRERGAEEVHLILTNPPLRWPCFYGIDFPSHEELIANVVDPNKNLPIAELEKRVAKEIGADSVHYQTTKDLTAALGGCENGHCLACINGNYPTPCGKKCAGLAK